MKHLLIALLVTFFTATIVAQSSQLHVQDDVGLGKYVSTIENLNHEGSGLKIKINGNHGMWIPFGPNSGTFPSHLPEPIDSLVQPILNKINQKIMNGESLSPPTFQDFVAILDPNNTEVGNLIKDLGLDKLLISGICAGQEALVDLISLPDINVPINLPSNIPDIPSLPTMGTSSIDLPNFPNPLFQLPTNIDVAFTTTEVVGITVVNGVTLDHGNTPINLPQLPNLTIPAFTPYNSAVNAVNSGIGTVNNGMESFLNEVGNIKAGIEAFDAAALIKSNLVGCNETIPFDEMVMNFPLPSSDIFEKALGLDNHFLTFVDQGDRELGSVRAIHPTEWTIEQVSTSNALEIASIIPGIISDDGNIIENVINLVKLGHSWVKGYNAIGVAYKSGFGDYAEWLPRAQYDEQITYGDIIGIKGGKIGKANLVDAEQVMVISKAPIVMGNAPAPDSIHLGNNVAFIGQVPVKITGSVHSGDYIVADLSKPGYGRAVPEINMSPEQYKFVVGKSWETNENPGFKYVQTIVGMHQNAWAAPIQKLQIKIQTLENSQQVYDQRLVDLSAQIKTMQTALREKL